MHRFSAGIVPVRLDRDRHRFLVLRCYDYWDFPKGGLWAGEQPLQTALRELEEETSLVHVSFPWGMDYLETGPYARGKIARYYVARVLRGKASLPISPVLGVPEHHEFRWVAFDEARKLFVPRVRAVLDWAEQRITRGGERAA